MSEEIKIKVSADASQAKQELDQVNKAASDVRKNGSAAPASPRQPAAASSAPSGFKPTIIEDGKVVARGTTAEAEEAKKAKAAAGRVAKAGPTASGPSGASSRLAENAAAAQAMAAGAAAADQQKKEQAAAAAAVIEKQKAKEAAEAEKKAAKEMAEAERQAAKSAKERAGELRQITRDQQRQTQAQERAENSQGRLMTRAAGVAGSAALAGGGVLAEHYFAGQTIEAQAKAQRAINARQTAILSGWRGGSGALQAQSFSAQDQAFALKQNQSVIKSNTNNSMIQQGLMGAGAGAASGAMIGPWGAVIGALLGGGTGVLRAFLGGKKQLKENAAGIKNAEETEADSKAKSEKRVAQGEVGVEMDMLRAKSRRSLEGQRTAFKDQKLLEWADTYKRLRGEGASDELAAEGAGLTVGNSIRDAQAQAGAGLVSAKSGAAESAAAARWGTTAFPGMDSLGSKLDALHGTLKNGIESPMTQNSK